MELSNQLSKVKFDFPDDQVTYLNRKPLMELSIMAVYLAVSSFAYIVPHSVRMP